MARTTCHGLPGGSSRTMAPTLAETLCVSCSRKSTVTPIGSQASSMVGSAADLHCSHQRSGVGAAASWLEGLDMAGPAAMLSAQGLNGADLLSFQTAAEFARDLGTTVFVARKVLRLRDQQCA